jgi:Zn finger protein HypA/HybF involved in hydrogenase expression
MHEAGIATAVAAEIRDRGLDPTRVRLVVAGGHGDLAAFDAALRAHLEAAAPGLGLWAVAIAHAPVPRLCAHCATQYRSVEAGASCPACGGPGIALSEPESVELEWDDRMPAAEGPERPDPHDWRPFTLETAGERLRA